MPGCVWRTQTKPTVRNEEARLECHVKTHWRLTFITVLTVHVKTSLLYTFQRSMHANRNINLQQEKAPFCRLSRSKAPKTQQICHYRNTRNTSELVLLFNTGTEFSPCNNFANSGSFAKVSIPVHIYNSLYKVIINLKLPHVDMRQNNSKITQNLFKELQIQQKRKLGNSFLVCLQQQQV